MIYKLIDKYWDKVVKLLIEINDWDGDLYLVVWSWNIKWFESVVFIGVNLIKSIFIFGVYLLIVKCNGNVFKVC